MGWQTGIVGAWLCIKRHFHRPYACLPSTKATKVSGACRVGHGLEGIVDSSQGVHQPNALPCPRQLTAATDRGFDQLTRNIKINGHTIGGNRNRGRFVMMLLELEPCLFFENAF